MGNSHLEKKFYNTGKFWIIAIATIVFLLIFGIVSAKNVPPDAQYMDIES